MTDPERYEGTSGREHQRYQDTFRERVFRGAAALTTPDQGASTQSPTARIRRAGERLLLLAEADGAVSEGGLPGG